MWPAVKSDEGKENEKIRGHRRSIITALMIFIVSFFGTICIIRVDTAAGGIIGNEPFFSSYFVRTGEREVDVKIPGRKMRIVNGIVVCYD